MKKSILYYNPVNTHIAITEKFHRTVLNLPLYSFPGISLFLDGGVLCIYDKYCTSMSLSIQKFFETMLLVFTSRRMGSSDSPILRMAPQIAWCKLAFELACLSPRQPRPRSSAGRVSLGADDAVAGRAFLPQVHPGPSRPTNRYASLSRSRALLPPLPGAGAQKALSRFLKKTLVLTH